MFPQIGVTGQHVHQHGIGETALVIGRTGMSFQLAGFHQIDHLAHRRQIRCVGFPHHRQCMGLGAGCSGVDGRQIGGIAIKNYP